MEKQRIYQAIEKFNNTPYDSSRSNSDPRHKVYHYVTNEIAADRAAFLGFLLENDPVFSQIGLENPRILDLAFGSGNLTTHLVLENFGDAYEEIIYNDINVENTFQEIEELLEKKEITRRNFLDSDQFGTWDESNIVVFNPQIGGGYKDGNSGLSDSATSIMYDGTLKEYLKSKGKSTEDLDFDKVDRSIYVTTEELTKTALRDIMKGISIFGSGLKPLICVY